MTVLDTLNFVAFNPLQNNNPIAVRLRKLIAKIDELCKYFCYNIKLRSDVKKHAVHYSNKSII